MSDMITEDFTLQVKEIVAGTANYIRKELGEVTEEQIEEKELNSLVSYVDKNAEYRLVESLGNLLPSAGFVTEEETEDDTAKAWTWIIDPLDGTTNFLFQIPHFCVSVALANSEGIQLGVVHEVVGNEQFFATKGGGAFVNDRPIRVTSKQHISDILVATGFPYSNAYDLERLVNIITRFLRSTRGIRRMGSAALDLCYVAAGRLGAYYETTLNVWDVAAGALIVQEAGGKVTDFKGGDDYLYGREILASAPQYHDDILSIIRS